MGDDLRRVHWPSSARHDDLMVRQDEEPWHGRLTILLDTRAGQSPTAFEEMVSAAASIALANIARGDQVRLLTTGGHDVGWGTGSHHRDRILENLAVVEQSEHLGGQVLDRLTAAGAGGAVVALTADTGELDDGLLRRAAGSYRSRVLVLFALAGATSVGAAGPVRSTTVVHVTPQMPFAEAWGRAVAPPPRVAR